jgi:hypothetical protein
VEVKGKDFSAINQASRREDVRGSVAQARPEESTKQSSKLKGVTNNSRIVRILQIS